jgi:hypothetical protein
MLVEHVTFDLCASILGSYAPVRVNYSARPSGELVQRTKDGS